MGGGLALDDVLRGLICMHALHEEDDLGGGVVIVLMIDI